MRDHNNSTLNRLRVTIQPSLEILGHHRVLSTLAVLLVLPFLVPYEALAVNLLIWGLFASGYNLLYGYTGQLSFGHAAFFGAGAYGCGIAMTRFGLDWVLAIAAGVILAALLAAAIGFFATRSRGIYFAMITLALAQCVYFVFYQAKSWTGGEDGLRGVVESHLQLFGLTLDLTNPTVKYYFILTFVAISLWLISRILASPFGAVLEAVRENENRARACGYSVATTKWVSLVLSSLFCGLAGALNAIHLSVVPTEMLHYQTSGQVLMMTLLGGAGTFFGPFVGAGFFLVLEDVTAAYTSHWQLVVGVVFMCCVLFFPAGICGSVIRWLKK